MLKKTPANGRQIGYLFQNLALFPHLDVASNVGYSLKVNGKKGGNYAESSYLNPFTLYFFTVYYKYNVF